MRARTHTRAHTHVVHVCFKAPEIHVLEGGDSQREGVSRARRSEEGEEGGVCLRSRGTVQLPTPQRGFEPNRPAELQRLQTNAHETRGKQVSEPRCARIPLPPSPPLVPGHASEAHRGGFSSVGPRVDGNPERRGARGERAPEPRSGGARGGRGGLHLKPPKKEGKRENNRQPQTWVYRRAVCIRPPWSRIASSRCGTGVSAGHRAPSTGPSTSCRNAGGRPDVLSSQMLLLHNSKHSPVSVLVLTTKFHKLFSYKHLGLK